MGDNWEASEFTDAPSNPLVDTADMGHVYEIPSAWQHALDGWRSDLTLRGHSTETRKVRRAHVRHIARRSGADTPSGLTAAQLVDICSNERWSSEHRKAVRASLQSFYRYCIGHGHAAEDIAALLPTVKPPSPCPRPATDEMIDALMRAAKPRERLMARLAAEAGLRRAEVAQAHRDDLIADRGGWSLRVRGKGGKQRVVPLTENLTCEIRACTDSGYLFPGKIDGHISKEYVGQLISALMPRGWSMHKLRHRYATQGYAGTGNLRAVQLALGHASVATTERYTAVTDLEVRAVSEAAARQQAS